MNAISLILKAGQSVLIEMLKAKIGELEQRVKKNSGSSSRPPLSDGLPKLPTDKLTT